MVIEILILIITIIIQALQPSDDEKSGEMFERRRGEPKGECGGMLP